MVWRTDSTVAKYTIQYHTFGFLVELNSGCCNNFLSHQLCFHGYEFRGFKKYDLIVEISSFF